MTPVRVFVAKGKVDFFPPQDLVGEKRDRVWQLPYVESRRLHIQKSADGLTPNSILPLVRKLESQKLWTSGLDAYLYCVEVASREWLEPNDTATLLECAAQQLERAGANSSRSRLNRLAGELYAEKARLARRNADRWNADWLGVLSGATPCTPTFDFNFTNLTSEAEPPLSTVQPSDPLPLQLQKVSRLRWSGQPEQASFLLQTLLLPSPMESAWDTALQSLGLSLKVQLNDDEASFCAAQRHALETQGSKELIEIHLWGLSSASKKARSWLSVYSHQTTTVGDFVFTLHQAYDSKGETTKWAELVGRTLGKVLATAPLETQVLCLAAAAKWLLRHKCPELYELCRFHYRNLSLHLSAGANRDILGRLPFKSNPSPLRAIPSTRQSRWTAAGKLGAAIFSIAAKHVVSSPFQSKSRKTQQNNQLLNAFCETIYRETDALKGGWMKLGQLAAYLGPDIPAEARRLLSRLQESSTPIASETIEAVVASELKRPVHELFAHWDRTPLATGSIGQVHRARTHQGEEVVVKVQYPGIRTIVDCDIQLLSFLIPLAKPFFPHWNFAELLREFRTRFLEECDYLAEAKNQMAFLENFSQDPEIVVPRVHSEFSSALILTSDFIAGKRFDDFLSTSSPEQRNRAAEIMTSWHWTSIFSHKLFSGDPHPGNFLFLPDQVAFIDFGNVKRWEGNACGGIRSVMDGLLADDFSTFAKGYALAEMSTDPTGVVVQEEYQKIRQHILGYLRYDREVEFNHEKAMQYFRSATTDNPNTRLTVKIQSECAVLFKAHWSFFATLGRLNPKINWRQIYLRSIS